MLHSIRPQENFIRRLFYVILITTLIAVVLWSLQHKQRLSVQLVYAYAIALTIWFLTDIVRGKLFPIKDFERWRGGWRVNTYLVFSIALGYVIGTWIGDQFAGWSTFDLLTVAPERFMGFLLISISISTVFIVFFYQQNRLQVAQHQAIQSKLQLLQSQLEPHMLFNTLANLRALVDIDPLRAQAMLDRLIDYLRATLGASRTATHPLKVEFARLDDYLALMQIRMGDRLSYQLDLPTELEPLHCPALLLQPLVENAVVHGLETYAPGGSIHVQARREQDKLIITVTDTGRGCDCTEGAPSTKGFGITHLQERLAALDSRAAHLRFSAHAPTGTLVTLTLPALAR